jgi:tape measure domain-containing protein
MDMSKRLQDFADARRSSSDVANAAQQLLAYKFSAQSILPSLRAIGDAVSAFGGGAFEMDRVVTALGQIKKGVTSYDELNQLSENGSMARSLPQKAFHLTPQALAKASQAGKISAAPRSP